MWLERAQAAAPGRPEIDVVEATLEVSSKRLGQARAVLDRLAAQGAQNYHVSLAEMIYGTQQRNVQHVETWYARASEQASNEIQRATALKVLADCYLENERWEESLRASHQLAELTPDDPWLWHNMSIVYLSIEDYEAALDANQRALSIMEFGVAQDMERHIKRQQQRAKRKRNKQGRGWKWWS